MLVILLLCAPLARAGIFGQVRGVVHDIQHRPISAAALTLRSASSGLVLTAVTGTDGSFQILSVPLGDYTLAAGAPGLATQQQSFTLASNSSPVLHFELAPAAVNTSISVETSAEAAAGSSATPTSLVSRADIAAAPGASRTNSLAVITNFAPGAYVTHDQLHIRGGHQVSWLIDGVQIPNTNIATNLGVQIDPKDIDYLEIQRGSYTADLGDRTYGNFNIVPRTGFERNRQGELLLSAGSFFQTNDQLNLGDHSQDLAWYLSLNGNRSDYGLAPPTSRVLHDTSDGIGGFGSVIDNRTPQDQLRLVAQLRHDNFQIPYDPDPASFGNQLFDSSGLRDSQSELDALTSTSWLHTFNASTVLQLSPFFHYNRASYQSSAADTPVATTDRRSSTYAGAQISVTGQAARNTLQGGLFSYGQHDSYLFGAAFNDGSGLAAFRTPDAASGGVVELYLSDNLRLNQFVTVIAGLRQSHFQAALTENRSSPRLGVAVRLPRLNWVLRGFYGRFYQPPPLLTAQGPVVQYAQASNTAFAPLRGERDEEHQIGLQIPFRGWVLDVDNFRTRVNNFLDHSYIGSSNISFPVTVDGALIRAWELSLRSPRIARVAQFHLAYSNQIAQQRGAINGGLICAPVTSPQCDAGFAYSPVDHDQRNTLNLGAEGSLPLRFAGSAEVHYGSGFTNGNPDPSTPYPGNYLPQHTTFDLALRRPIGERATLSLNALNVADRRVLLDNSTTFGGLHFNDPRELYAELRYRFHF